MSAVLICYDLNAPGQNYEQIHSSIEKLGAWCRIQRSVWIVKTILEPVQVRDVLRQKIDTNDSLFVTQVAGQSAWSSMTPEVSKWLHDNL